MCKWNFKVIYEQYKYDNITNDISCYDHHECPFNDAVDNSGHQSGNVIRYVITFIRELMKLKAIHNSK
jgi:hypothetical protein